MYWEEITDIIMVLYQSKLADVTQSKYSTKIFDLHVLK
jgi:hypothetical protein